MGKMSRDKGARGEREVASLCKAFGYEARRTSQSDGRFEADVEGLPGIHIEVKRTEKFSLYDALAQAFRDRKNGELCAVFHRKNNCKWVVAMDAEEWFRLYREWESK